MVMIDFNTWSLWSSVGAVLSNLGCMLLDGLCKVSPSEVHVAWRGTELAFSFEGLLATQATRRAARSQCSHRGYTPYKEAHDAAARGLPCENSNQRGQREFLSCGRGQEGQL